MSHIFIFFVVFFYIKKIEGYKLERFSPRDTNDTV